jgi:hypothetical protein
MTPDLTPTVPPSEFPALAQMDLAYSAVPEVVEAPAAAAAPPAAAAGLGSLLARALLPAMTVAAIVDAYAPKPVDVNIGAGGYSMRDNTPNPA